MAGRVHRASIAQLRLGAGPRQKLKMKGGHKSRYTPAQKSAYKKMLSKERRAARKK
jgi:hypothetical protein